MCLYKMHLFSALTWKKKSAYTSLQFGNIQKKRVKIYTLKIILNKLYLSHFINLFWYSGVSQKFCNILVELMKVMNHNGLWVAELAWYSLHVTCQIYFNGLMYDIEIYSSRPTWACLILEVLVTQAKFLQTSWSLYCVSNIFTFCTRMLWSSSNS